MLNTSRSSRRYGVEVEFINLDYDDLERIAKSLGIGMEYWDLDYDEEDEPRDYSKWSYTSDGSLRDNKGDDIELVSPIIQTKTQEDQLKEILRCIREDGGSVNKSCGLHVHMDISDLSFRDIRTIVYKYNQFEEEIDKFMPKSRRKGNHSYCLPTNQVYDKIHKRLRDCGAFDEGDFEKYRKINLGKMDTTQTMEFRHHSGTLNFTKIINWVRFLDQFITNALEEERDCRRAPFNADNSILYNSGFHSMNNKEMMKNFVRQIGSNGIIDLSAKGLERKVFGSSRRKTQLTLKELMDSILDNSSLTAYPLKGSKTAYKIYDWNNWKWSPNVFNGIDYDLVEFYKDREKKLKDPSSPTQETNTEEVRRDEEETSYRRGYYDDVVIEADSNDENSGARYYF